MSSRRPTDLVNVDFWADRIAAVIKLAEHYGMAVEIAGRELVVSRRVSEAFTARTEVRWRPEPPAVEAQQQPDTETPGCPDPIECTHEAALGEAEAEAERQLAAVQRVRHVLEVEPVLNRSALEYRGLILAALMADEAQQPEPAAGVRQPDTDERRPRPGDRDPDRIVGYRSKGGRLLRCLAHHPGQESLDTGNFHPVTSDDLPDGGTCTFPTWGSTPTTCGVDVLIPREADRG